MILPCIYFIIKQMKMQTYIPKICSIFHLTNKCSCIMIQIYKQLFVTNVRM